MDSASRPAAATAYPPSARRPSCLRLLAMAVFAWIAHSAFTKVRTLKQNGLHHSRKSSTNKKPFTKDYETELRSYLQDFKSITDEEIDKLVPLSFREKQKVTREKEESISKRLERLEISVDELRAKLFGSNATSISKVEKI